jgi:hypothetical protein
MDMSGPVLHERETLEQEPIPTTTTAASPATAYTPLTPSQRRAEFIYDMTFMPLPVVVERLERDGPDCWRNQLESAERLAGERWYEYLIHPKRVGRFWRSLRYSLECLQDGEFRERFASSPHTWLECRGTPYTEGTPFFPVIELLQQSFGFRRDDTAAIKIEKLERGITPVKPAIDDAVPLLAGFLGLPLPDGHRPLELSPELRARATEVSIAAWRKAEARQPEEAVP